LNEATTTFKALQYTNYKKRRKMTGAKEREKKKKKERNRTMYIDIMVYDTHMIVKREKEWKVR
jgi:hypothetical protein